MTQLCRQCHAQVDAAANLTACPACGGALVTQPESALEASAPGVPPAPVDHRGILLPRRHAVGGIITPR